MILAIMSLLVVAQTSNPPTFTPADLAQGRIGPALPGATATDETLTWQGERCVVTVTRQGDQVSVSMKAPCPALWAFDKASGTWSSDDSALTLTRAQDHGSPKVYWQSCDARGGSAVVSVLGADATPGSKLYARVGQGQALRWVPVNTRAAPTVDIKGPACPGSANPITFYVLGKGMIEQSSPRPTPLAMDLLTVVSTSAAQARLNDLLDGLSEAVGGCDAAPTVPPTDAECAFPRYQVGIDGAIEDAKGPSSAGCVAFQAYGEPTPPASLVVRLKPSKAPASAARCVRLEANKGYDLAQLYEPDETRRKRLTSSDPLLDALVLQNAPIATERAARLSAAMLPHLATECLEQWHVFASARIHALVALGRAALPSHRGPISASAALDAYRKGRETLLAPSHVGFDFAAACPAVLSLLADREATEALTKQAEAFVDVLVPSVPTADDAATWTRFATALDGLDHGDGGPLSARARTVARRTALAALAARYAAQAKSTAIWLPLVEVRLPLVRSEDQFTLLVDGTGRAPRGRSFAERVLVAATRIPRADKRTLVVLDDGEVKVETDLGNAIAGGLAILVRASSAVALAAPEALQPGRFPTDPDAKESQKVLAAIAALPTGTKYRTEVVFRDLDPGRVALVRLCVGASCKKDAKEADISAERRVEVLKHRWVGLVTEAGLNFFGTNPAGGYGYQRVSANEGTQTIYALDKLSGVDQSLAVSQLLTLRFPASPDLAVSLGLGPTLYAGGDFSFGRQWAFRLLFEPLAAQGITINVGVTLRSFERPYDEGQRIALEPGVEAPKDFASKSQVDAGFFFGFGVDATVLTDAASALAKAVGSK